MHSMCSARSARAICSFPRESSRPKRASSRSTPTPGWTIRAPTRRSRCARRTAAVRIGDVGWAELGSENYQYITRYIGAADHRRGRGPPVARQRSGGGAGGARRAARDRALAPAGRRPVRLAGLHALRAGMRWPRRRSRCGRRSSPCAVNCCSCARCARPRSRRGDSGLAAGHLWRDVGDGILDQPVHAARAGALGRPAGRRRDRGARKRAPAPGAR